MNNYNSLEKNIVKINVLVTGCLNINYEGNDYYQLSLMSESSKKIDAYIEEYQADMNLLTPHNYIIPIPKRYDLNNFMI